MTDLPKSLASFSSYTGAIVAFNDQTWTESWILGCPAKITTTYLTAAHHRQPREITDLPHELLSTPFRSSTLEP